MGPMAGTDNHSQGTVRAVAHGMSSAMDQAATAAGRTTNGMLAFRDAVRRMPLAMSLVMLGMGYLIGTVIESRPRGRR